MVMRIAVLAIVVCAACASFEDPTLVIDLRVIAMTMTPGPERVIDIDLQADQLTVDDILAELEQEPRPVVCALVADPQTTQDLRYSMKACLLDEDGARCDPAKPQMRIADSEILYDPEVWIGGAMPACAELPVDATFVAMLYESLQDSPASALVGVDYAVELRIGRMNDHPEADVYAVKKGRVSARIPETRQANRNPEISELQISRPSGITVGTSRPCAQPFGFLADIRAGETVTLYPVEAEASRETFVVPTLDGEFVEYTEYHSYQWLAQRGSFSDEMTGGPPDLLGNQSLLGTDWKAPSAGELTGPTDIPIWVVQRDDRYGVTWVETCIKVVP